MEPSNVASVGDMDRLFRKRVFCWRDEVWSSVIDTGDPISCFKNLCAGPLSEE